MRGVTQEREEKRKIGLAWRQRGFRDGNLKRPRAKRGVDIPEDYWSFYFDGWCSGDRERKRREEMR